MINFSENHNQLKITNIFIKISILGLGLLIVRFLHFVQSIEQNYRIFVQYIEQFLYNFVQHIKQL